MESRTLKASAAPAKAEIDVHRRKYHPRGEPDERVTERHQATAYRGRECSQILRGWKRADRA